MNAIIPAEFHGTPLSIIDRDGQKWLTAEEVGRCLGYAETNASQGVRNLYNRHADEFAESDTCQLKLMWQGQSREVRVFSAEGCVMLAMFANTPRAKEFRLWAKRVLAEKSQPLAVVEPAPQQLALAQEVGFLKDQLLATQQAMLGLYEKLDISHGKHIRALGVLARQREAQAKRESVEAVIRLEAEGLPREEIARLTGKTLNCVRQHVFRARQDGRLPPAPDDERREADGRFKAQGELGLGGAA